MTEASLITSLSPKLSRRAWLKGSGALVLGVHLPLLATFEAEAAIGINSFVPINAWL